MPSFDFTLYTHSGVTNISDFAYANGARDVFGTVGNTINGSDFSALGEVTVSDSDDNTFSDAGQPVGGASGYNQRLTGLTNWNQFYSVEVELDEKYTLTNTATSEVVHVYVVTRTSNNNDVGYAIVGNFDPNATYEVTSPESAPGAVPYSSFNYVCFAPDALIDTDQGPRAVQDLSVGDRVRTMDHGLQPLIWVGSRALTFGAEPNPQKPILIAAGALGPGLPRHDLIVSPQHRILLAGDDVSAQFGRSECLGMAKGLTRLRGIREMNGKKQITYHSLLTARHQIIFANDLAVETLFPAPYAMSLLSPFDRLMIRVALPHLTDDTLRSYGALARKELKPRDVERLASVHGKGHAAAGYKNTKSLDRLRPSVEVPG